MRMSPYRVDVVHLSACSNGRDARDARTSVEDYSVINRWAWSMEQPVAYAAGNVGVDWARNVLRSIV